MPSPNQETLRLPNDGDDDANIAGMITVVDIRIRSAFLVQVCL